MLLNKNETKFFKLVISIFPEEIIEKILKYVFIEHKIINRFIIQNNLSIHLETNQLESINKHFFEKHCFCTCSRQITDDISLPFFINCFTYKDELYDIEMDFENLTVERKLYVDYDYLFESLTGEYPETDSVMVCEKLPEKVTVEETISIFIAIVNAMFQIIESSEFEMLDKYFTLEYMDLSIENEKCYLNFELE